MHLVFLLFLVLTAGAKISLAISGSGGNQEICVTLGRSRGEPSKVRTDVSLWHTLCSYSDVSDLILLQDSASRLVVTAQTGAFQPFVIPVTPWTQLPAKSLGMRVPRFGQRHAIPSCSFFGSNFFHFNFIDNILQHCMLVQGEIWLRLKM